MVETIDSVGLGGRSGCPSVAFGADNDVVEEFAAGDSKARPSRGVLTRLSEDPEALIVAKRRRRSSNGAPVPSPLAPLMTREGLRMGVRDAIDAFDLRDDSDGNRERVVVPASLCRALRNTVCGTTPSFCSSMLPTTLRLIPVSGSELSRDAKLEVAFASFRV